MMDPPSSFEQGSVGALFRSDFTRTRLIAAIALLAVALGAFATGPRLGAAPGLFAMAGHGERWLANADDIQPAKLESAKGAAIEKRPAPSGAPELAALQETAQARPTSSPYLAASFDASPPVAAAHRRPHPTGPPFLG